MPMTLTRAPRPQRWRQNPEAVRRDILAAAREEFALKGLSGARVDEIAARTATAQAHDLQLFWRQGRLYRAVLEEAYRGIRELERTLELKSLPPAAALAELAGVTFDYHADHPEFVRLVMVENIHHAEHLKASSIIGALNSSAVGMLAEIYAAGVAEGTFRPGLDPLGIHRTISALSFYNVSNRATIREVFGHDMGEAGARARRRAEMVETVLRYVRP